MTSRRSSGSSRAESAVEPIRSQNITLSGRRSAVVSDVPRLSAGSVGGPGETGTKARSWAASRRRATIASNRRRRWRIKLTPMSFSSSPVSVGNTSASTPFSRNAASYWSRPRARSQTATSIAVASNLTMQAADYHADEPPLSRQRSRPFRSNSEKNNDLHFHSHLIVQFGQVLVTSHNYVLATRY